MQTVESLSCNIELPDDWDDRQRSLVQVVDNNQNRRRYPRQTCRANAAMRPRKTLPPIRRNETWSRILLQNISRCGVGFLHSEQLYPEEEAIIVFPNGSQRILRVMRCRRLGPKCFEVGGEFTATQGEGTTATTSISLTKPGRQKSAQTIE